LLKPAELKSLLSKEDEKEAFHPVRKTESKWYREIFLITDLEPEFIPDIEWKEGEEVKKHWYSMALHFYLPKAKKIIPVCVHNCWFIFSKHQQAKIASWFKHYLTEHDELDTVFIPLFLKEASRLVGAPLGSMTHQEVQQVHEDSAQYKTGYVYDEAKYQSLCVDVNAEILQATFGDSKEVFFPSCSNKNLLAYDCLIKTVNFIMGFPLFTLREQGIRMIMKERHRNLEKAAIIKMKGGIPMECMTNFAVDDNFAYSFDFLRGFDYFEMMDVNSEVKGYCPGKEVLLYIKDIMLTRPLHTKLLVVLKGKVFTEFQHALCFVRKDFGRKKQLLMMDCKNSGPCVYPCIYEDQLQYQPEDKVDGKKDLYDDVYYAADIYTLSARPVSGKEKRKLENHMKWVLTGEDEHWMDSEAIG